MKKSLILSFSLAAGLSTVTVAFGQFPADVRQALQQTAADVQSALEQSTLSRTKTITILPLYGDQGEYVEGLLKNAATAAGLTYAEAGDGVVWEQVLKEVEWDERKEDILDPETLIKFGKLKATRLLLYGGVRDATQAGKRVFVELELHVSDLETKEHVWGQVFTTRFYQPGETQGIIALDNDLKEALRTLIENGTESLKNSEKLADIRNVAILPLAGDIDGYVTALAEKMVSATDLYPKDLEIVTLAEARAFLKEDPSQADALFYGAVRDLSRVLAREEVLKKTYEVSADVQFRIQSTATGEILWSETLSHTWEVLEEQTPEEVGWAFFKKDPKTALYIAAAAAVFFIILRLIKARSTPR